MPDQKALEAGYAEGLKQFCTPEFSYQFAREGGTYRGTCPTDSENKMEEKFKSGRIEFLEIQVSKLEQEVSTLQAENSSLQSRPVSCPTTICPSCEICMH